MKKIVYYMLLSCLKATELIEKRFHYKLTFKEKVQLKIHTSMCKGCKAYESQSFSLEQAIQNINIIQNSKRDIEKLKDSIKLLINNNNF